MSLALLTQTLRDMYNNTRPEISTAENIYDALVSDLAVGDWLIGMRARITVLGATSGTPPMRALTIIRDGITSNVSWPASSTLRIQR